MKKKIVKTLLPRSLFTLLKNAYILGFKFGQFKSVRWNLSVDQNGNPIPWYTYPAIEYLRQFDYSKKRVFEYGSGNSTFFWANLCNLLVSVEDDRQWYENIESKLPSNVDYHLALAQDEYVQTIRDYSDTFDVIIIDGSYRFECAVQAVRKISENAMIILDNSDWHEKTSKFLRNSDLIQVDMAGFGPLNPYTWTTSLFLTRDFRFQLAVDRQPMHGIGSLLIRRES